MLIAAVTTIFSRTKLSCRVGVLELDDLKLADVTEINTVYSFENP